MFDTDNPTFLVGRLPKAEAFFTTVEGGELTMTFLGVVHYERPCGVITVGAAPGPECAKYEPGVQTMAYTYSKRAGLRYKFGNINDQLDPSSALFGFNRSARYRNMCAEPEDAFDHQYYFLNSPTCDMYVLKPVRVTD